MMKKYQLLHIFLLFFVTTSMYSQKVWTKHSDNSKVIGQELEYRASIPAAFETYGLNTNLIDDQLRTVSVSENIIELPTPNGIQRFLVKEASVLAPELAAKFPTIKSYSGIGIDDKTARVRFSKSQAGFHAMISSGNYPLYLIDPYTRDKNTVIAYYKSNSQKSEFECLIEEAVLTNKQKNLPKQLNANDGKLRTYRLALIGTGEYSQFHLTNQGVGAGESDATKKAAVLAVMNTSMTRINGIFERDLGVTMELVANNADLIFLDPVTDGLTNEDITSLVPESQSICDTVIGDANYDIGHAFGQGAGNGLAAFQAVCSTGEKGEGASILESPMGDAFDIDVVAHEMGHQFGANHTQNNNDCNRNNATAVEPGSGVTIMGYAGWCDPSVQDNSDAFFHSVSIAEMWGYISTTAICGVETATNNAAPVADAGIDYTIPKSTPFVLKGSATDADAGNSLTYSWEQIDNETATMPPLATNTTGPLFRPFLPTSSPNRYVPVLDSVLIGKITTKWEVVPSVARTMNFSFTVRDNVSNGGATGRDDTVVTVDATSGPFVVTSQSVATTLEGGSTQTVTWDVANTTAAPVSAADVNILISIDGGETFSTLKSNTPNDGSEQVVLPDENATKVRIKVEAANNIFYAVNSTDFSIDKSAGLDDEFFSNFSVYPNPTDGIVNLSFDIISSNDVAVELFDIRGRSVNRQEFKVSSLQFQKELNYQSIAKGLYVLKVENGQYRISRKILID